ncbi:MAG: insulinase family protein [Myxococcales bacterium]|nr:insulinase family protein [Myxococcales bacterium]MDH3842655.1 insulinase family protein [Myxococcales bacterium]
MTRATKARLLVESSNVLPLVDVEIAFRVGSLQDPIGKEGLAQLTGQLLRRGPHGISADSFEDRLANLGARLTVDTAMRTTRIRATTLRRNLEPLLDLVADMVWRPALRARDFAKLKRHAQASLLSRLDDDQTLGAIHLRERLFAGHPYGRSTSGSADSLRRINLRDAERFYTRYLETGAFIVGVSGDISDSEAESLVDAHFPRRTKKMNGKRDVPATHIRRGRHVVIVDKPERTQTQLYIGTLGARTHDRNLFPLIVSNTAFGGTFTGPLMQEVRAVRGWSYGAYSRLTHSDQRDAWYMWSAPSAEYSADCAALELELLDRWVENGLAKASLKFAQQYLINSHCFNRDTPSKRLESRLDIELLGVPRRYVERHDELVAQVTRKKANDATRARISPRDLVMVVVATAKDVKNAFEKLPGVSSVEVVPYRQP